ncbi:cytochrome c oxidase assembly protein [Jiella sp. MQZ9-1]|uniref:Cytochrome c oxidase assembly protein CtaG n=1 Tax=Jiella flava TaxID=2816857 RepID=A0A939G0D4_9HYPH|nr:cytochrome c oxidase assembly protein [Jiella flava]MBO0663520.1 cytochrome c oxidase assembly protein [Jiella flava]MCD2472095.1 cytochrome c oxidase assembly protein [Jiella flava]
MSDDQNVTENKIRASKRTGLVIAIACGAFAAGMVGAAFASVPLYQLFCQVTGYGGTTQRARVAPKTISDKEVTVRFDGNVAEGLPWTFRPNQREVRVHLGEQATVSYHVENKSDKTLTGQAIFNVTPDAAGLYFNKIACFCFSSQTLKPGEKTDMQIIFYVDPKMTESEELKELPSITLSYTFFPVDNPAPVVAAPTAPRKQKKGTDS